MRIKQSIILLSVIILLTLSLAGCSSEEVAQEEKVVPVSTLKIEPTTIVGKGTFSGQVKSKNEVVVSTKVPGNVKDIYVNVGDTVKEGDVLFELENQDLRASVEQANQNLLIAQANLDNINKGARPQEIEQVNQSVNQAKTQLDITKTNFERTKELYEAEAISQQRYDQALAELNMAEAAYKSALEKQSLIEEGASEDTIKAAEAQVGLAQANLKLAQAKLDDTIIESPISGRIGFVNYERGEFVMQGTPAIQVLDAENMVVDLELSEEYISKINLGDEVVVSIESLSNKGFNGTVTEINPAADKKSRLYPIKISITNTGGEIKSGMTAKVTLELDKKENVIAVPVDATFEEYGELYVYIVEEGRAVKTKIKTGINDGKQVEIIEGLQLDDVLVVGGQNNLRDGNLINEGGVAE